MTPLEVYTSPGPVRLVSKSLGIDVYHYCRNCVGRIGRNDFEFYEIKPSTCTAYSSSRKCDYCDGFLFRPTISTTRQP